jgi:hypothetical protein
MRKYGGIVQLHVSAALIPEKEPPVPMGKRMDGPQGQSGCSHEEKTHIMSSPKKLIKTKVRTFIMTQPKMNSGLETFINL